MSRPASHASPSPRRPLSPGQRLVALLLLLQERGRATTATIAARLGIARRKALDDLKRLAEVAPIEHVGQGHRAEWLLAPLKGMHGFGVLDRLALEIGRDAVRFLSGTCLSDGLERAVEAAPSVPRKLASHIDRKFRYKPEPARRFEGLGDIIDSVLDGLLRERLLHIRYEATAGARHYPAFAPLTLVTYRRAVYLLGRDEGDSLVRRLAVDRIRSCEVGEPFDYPTDWCPDTELQPWFGITATGPIDPVILHFDAKVARFVLDRHWHETARLTRHETGGVTLTMNTGGLELLPFVLEWGEHVEVEKPTWLRERVVATHRAALQRYTLLPPA